MNKNTLLAFLLMMVAVWFFSSDLYYTKILRKPPRRKAQQESVRPQEEATEAPREERETSRQEGAVSDTIAERLGESVEDTTERVEHDTVWVETATLVVGISERGGRIISVRTKEYRFDDDDSERGGEMVELVDVSAVGGANLAVNGKSLDNAHFEANVEGTTQVGEGEEFALRLVHEQDGVPIEKVFRFVGSGYEIGYEVRSPQLAGKRVEVGWGAGIRESEKSADDRAARYDIRKVHLFDGNDVEHLSSKKAEVEERTGFYKWVGLSSKYFLVALIADSVADADIAIAAYEAEGELQDGKKKTDINYGYRVKRFAGETEQRYHWYVGPAQLTALKETGVGLEKVLFGGWKWFFRADKWFPALCEFILWLLVTLYGVVKDYGVVILILTLISKVVTFPLTQSSMKSMNRMKELQPKINALREKYKSNPRKMNEKLMGLYKQEGVSPFQMGCLPMFLQMPIFISLFVVLRKAIELRGAGTVLIPWVDDLSKAEMLVRIPTLPLIGQFYGNNFAVLPIVMAALTFFQQKATVKDPNQKAMIYIMPVFMLVLFNSFPAGLVLYWTFSSALQLVQQFYIDRRRAAAAAGH